MQHAMQNAFSNLILQLKIKGFRCLLADGAELSHLSSFDGIRNVRFAKMDGPKMARAIYIGIDPDASIFRAYRADHDPVIFSPLDIGPFGPVERIAHYLEYGKWI